MSKNFRDLESLGKRNWKSGLTFEKKILGKGVKLPCKKSLFLGEFFKDQEFIPQGSVGYTTRIRRLYNKDQVIMFSDAIIEPLQKTFAYKECKITESKK